MNLLTYLKYQILCLARSQNALLVLQNVGLQAMPIAMIWIYPFVESEPIQIYISLVLATAAMITASENLFAWHYRSVFLLYVAPFPILRRKKTLLSLLYALFFFALIGIVLFYSVIRTTFPPEKHLLFIVCFLVGVAVAMYEVLMISIYHAAPIKKNAFSFGEKTPQSNFFSVRRVLMLILPMLAPTLVFYSVAQYSVVAWFVFASLYVCAVLGLFFWQLQSFPQKAYDARFHLYQSLKG